jgi:hypothetical protein
MCGFVAVACTEEKAWSALAEKVYSAKNNDFAVEVARRTFKLIAVLKTCLGG